MKLLIAGSRDFNDYSYLNERISRIQDNNVINFIISGKAQGADTLGTRFALEHSIEIKEYPAEWDLYGKSAGMIRNKLMGEEADRAVIFWDGKSRGTKNMMDIMKKLHKPCTVYFYNEQDEFEDF